MIFSSVTFLFYFLPLCLFCYYVSPTKYRNIVLLIFSLIFYAWGEPIYIFLMCISVGFNYFFAFKVNSKNKFWFIIAVAINILFLAIFKYSGFIIENINNFLKLDLPIPQISLPLGISFYTFQALSYVVDVYRRNAKIQKNIYNLALYITAFPQLVAGPIVRYTTIMDQIDNRIYKEQRFKTGIIRFILGMSKKVLISNQLGLIADNIFLTTSNSTITAWIGIISYTLQIYFDFSGYSDMAIGLGKMLGFDYDENFDYPYISKSITEFWRRWHISLSSWFRDYLYIPLGGNRASKPRHILNLLIVWFLTGLWHGAAWNFIFWGLYYGIFIIIEKYANIHIKKMPKILSHTYTMLIIMIGWVFFRANNLTTAFSYLKSLFTFETIIDTTARLYLHDNLILIIIAIICSTPLIKKIKLIFNNKFNIIQFILIFVLFFLCILYLVNSTYNPFIYFRF